MHRPGDRSSRARRDEGPLTERGRLLATTHAFALVAAQFGHRSTEAAFRRHQVALATGHAHLGPRP
ncbi:hypothetical protein ABZ656_57085 [Streptomyces sp. NPDC007095]|uniref:hypothetical protein n=1 Tax=Streptomyces sp. NPDC007095 TaxID=3154482 RepID=UPI0015D58217